MRRWGWARVTAVGETTERKYYFFDLLGSTQAMAPAVEGSPTDRLYYTPWGQMVTTGPRASTVGTTGNPYRYVGQLGYYYHWQAPSFQDWLQLGVRFYNPSLGRFERRDPEGGEVGGVYGYTGGSPLTWLDPDGREPVTAAALCALAALAYKTWTSTAAVGNGLIACYAFRECTRCLARSEAMAKRAKRRMEPDEYSKWFVASRPTEECADICKTAGERGIRALFDVFLRAMPHLVRCRPSWVPRKGT